MSFDKIAENLCQGMLDIKPGGKEAVMELLALAKKENRQLRVKFGIDPTSSDLHLGHMVCIQKLKEFQELGHLPVLIIGGYTAQIGDPSGRNEARPPLSSHDVAKYAKTYLDQVARVLDLTKVEVVNNADWFDKFSMTDFVKLASRVTVNQMISKDAFGKRLDQGLPVFMHETIYPLLQGYDSYQVRADIELGGTDQLFNLMVGRDIQKAYEAKPQMAMTMPLLVGLDGVKKMSKTSQNYIALSDSPQEIFGKVMSIPDDLILDYYILAARASLSEVAELKNKLNDPAKFNPRDIKAALGEKLVSIYYSETEAKQASENFTKQFREKEIPDDISDFKLNGSRLLADVLVATGMCPSKGEAKRLVQGGGVKLNGEKLSDPLQELIISEPQVLQAGKRKFVRLLSQN